MIEFEREPQGTIASSSVRILGLGGAGANMLDRVALDGMEGAELLALNTDVRTLSASVARDKIQLGEDLTKGLGAGGDPELGRQATLEAEESIREALKGRRIVFMCVGLGGGTGSGGAPLVARWAREEGAFVVVFATMPFSFEGRRRREQAEEALNQLVVLANALVTFDNGRMGELVLAKQGVHEAFSAGDRMISESIKAVIRLVIRPGLINVGLDDLMSALRTTRSRCLFGSGVAKGKDRATKALRNALASPLLDQGALLREAETVLVHLCGGEDLTLYEIELMMQKLGKHVPSSAHVLFGAAVDPAIGDGFSVTLISALPEERLRALPELEIEEEPEPEPEAEPEIVLDPEPEAKPLDPGGGFEFVGQSEPEPPVEPEVAAKFSAPEPESVSVDEADEDDDLDGDPFTTTDFPEQPSVFEKPEDLPFAETVEPMGDEKADDGIGELDDGEVEAWESAPATKSGAAKPATAPADDEVASGKPEPKKAAGKGRKKRGRAQSELSFEGGPTGKFAGESPNVFEGENLDIPSFLRKKK